MDSADLQRESTRTGESEITMGESENTTDVREEVSVLRGVPTTWKSAGLFKLGPNLRYVPREDGVSLED